MRRELPGVEAVYVQRSSMIQVFSRLSFYYDKSKDNLKTVNPENNNTKLEMGKQVHLITVFLLVLASKVTAVY